MVAGRGCRVATRYARSDGSDARRVAFWWRKGDAHRVGCDVGESAHAVAASRQGRSGHHGMGSSRVAHSTPSNVEAFRVGV